MTAARGRVRTIADIEIGAIYSVVVGGCSRKVRIESRVSSGVWLGLNMETGRNLYVTFGDLGEQLVSESVPNLRRIFWCVSCKQQSQCNAAARCLNVSGGDRKRLAAGDREDQ
jgi:hypothetical protein